MSKKINYTFESDEERYFYEWLVELYDLGYIEWIYPDKKTYKIVNNVITTRVIQQKTKEKKELFILTKERKYTPDFIFKFNDKAKALLYHDNTGGYNSRPYFYCNNNRGIIYVDVKGSFGGKLNSSITFPDRQSIMCDRFNIYVQKVIPYANKPNKQTLFRDTFTPQILIDTAVYKSTRAGKWVKGASKLKYNVTKVNEYLC